MGMKFLYRPKGTNKRTYRTMTMVRSEISSIVWKLVRCKSDKDAALGYS